jgi:hypothetical protein
LGGTAGALPVDGWQIKPFNLTSIAALGDRFRKRERKREMKTTLYFAEQVLRKRPFIYPSQCAEVVARPLRRLIQEDGRIRHWGWVVDSRDGTTRALRVVTLDDGETIHNAFFDRNFRENAS